jgi:hypothetical protein
MPVHYYLQRNKPCWNITFVPQNTRPSSERTQPVREVVKPNNQLQLSEAELNDEVAKMLTANNPTAPKNIARYNVKERAYKVSATTVADAVRINDAEL